MRKYLVSALAIVLLAVFVSIAYASHGTPTYVAPSGNPHGDYQVNTQKCGVCHSVHHAGENGDGLGSEILLRTDRANACTYCHIDPGVSVKIVYSGDLTAYNPVADSAQSHDVKGGASCTGCHQVHAARNAMTDNAGLTVKILKEQTVLVDDNGVATNTVQPAAGDAYQLALTKWCSTCHGYYNLEKNGATHVMKAAAGSGYVASTYCNSCHSDTTQPNMVAATIDPPGRPGGAGLVAAFPHRTNGARFLQSAETSVSGNGGTLQSASDAANDGVCLRCHVQDSNTGIGRSF